MVFRLWLEFWTQWSCIKVITRIPNIRQPDLFLPLQVMYLGLTSNKLKDFFWGFNLFAKFYFLTEEFINIKQGKAKRKLRGIIFFTHQRFNRNKTGYASDLGKMLSCIWQCRQKHKTAILPCEARHVYTLQNTATFNLYENTSLQMSAPTVLSMKLSTFKLST